MDLRGWISNPKPGAGARLARSILRLASFPYGFVIALRNTLYDRQWKAIHDCQLPVVSIGNLSVGGTGKTPTVAWIARWYRARNVRVAILSRGYGQLASGSNDEALELELKLPDVPHLQDPDRVASAALARDELGMQLLVLDDGFQHRRLKRSLDVVLIDATDPPHLHRLLPGGLLREPFRSLRRAQVVLLTRCNLSQPEHVASLRQKIQKIAPNVDVVESSHRETQWRAFPDEVLPLPSLRSEKVLAFCAIGNPSAFFHLLENQGLDLVDRRVWPDHHAYQGSDVEQLVAWTRQHSHVRWIVCTMKDWVKLQVRQLGAARLVALEIDVQLGDGASILEQRLVELLEQVEDRELDDTYA